MLFIFCVSSLLLIYCLVIKIGHHTVSFNRYLAMISGSLWLCALLDLYKIIQLPMILKLGIILGVGYGIFFVTMLALFSKQRDQKHHDIDVIFVFGAGLIGNRITLSLKKRLQKVSISLYTKKVNKQLKTYDFLINLFTTLHCQNEATVKESSQ